LSIFWTQQGAFRRVDYESENDLEQSILQVKRELFGLNRIYLDVKKK